MLHRTRAIVLRTIAHGDRSRVMQAYTQESGRRSYFARTGRKGGAAAAAFQPLARVELTAQGAPDRDLHQLREIRVDRPYHRVHADPVRGGVLLFLQELLVRVLREESPDPALFAFLDYALTELDEGPDPVLFPQLFLVQLSRHLGFFPEAPDGVEGRFDLKEGRFLNTAEHSGHAMDEDVGKALAYLLEVPIGGASDMVLPGDLRRRLLDQLLLYYRFHVEGLGELRSPAVLHQVLH